MSLEFRVLSRLRGFTAQLVCDFALLSFFTLQASDRNYPYAMEGFLIRTKPATLYLPMVGQDWKLAFCFSREENDAL